MFVLPSFILCFIFLLFFLSCKFLDKFLFQATAMLFSRREILKKNPATNEKKCNFAMTNVFSTIVDIPVTFRAGYF